MGWQPTHIPGFTYRLAVTLPYCRSILVRCGDCWVVVTCSVPLELRAVDMNQNMRKMVDLGIEALWSCWMAL
jgi:hypothetical protein